MNLKKTEANAICTILHTFVFKTNFLLAGICRTTKLHASRNQAADIRAKQKQDPKKSKNLFKKIQKDSNVAEVFQVIDLTICIHATKTNTITQKQALENLHWPLIIKKFLK